MSDTPAEPLAADGANVVDGIDEPTDDELLAYLADQGWTKDGPPA